MSPNSDPTFKMKTIMWFVLVLGPLTAAGEVVIVKSGEKATLKCGGDSDPMNLAWDLEGKLVSRYIRRGSPSKGPIDVATRSRLMGADLTINGVKTQDAGQFTCTADYKKFQHTLLVMSVSASPSTELQLGSKATLQCQVGGLNTDPPVQWKKPGGDKLIESNTVELNSVALSDAGTWACMFSHDGKTKTVNLDIKVKATEASTLSPSKTSISSKTTCLKCGPISKIIDASGPLGLSLWVWVGIGVGSLVAISLMIIVIILYKKIKKRRQRHRRLKNSRQPLTPRQFCQCDHPTAAAKPQQGRRREKPC